MKKPKVFQPRAIPLALFLPDMHYYLTWHKRPRTHIHHLANPSGVCHEDTGIVMQGDLASTRGYAIETVKIYRKLFPGVKIVISTWDTAAKVDVDALEDLGATVVMTKPPVFPGPFNRNMQLLSSSAGVIEASAQGVKYILKIRMDQRLYSPHALSLMKGLVEAFPVSGGPANQDKRLVVLSNNTFINRIYGVSDFLTFGLVRDVLTYWDFEHGAGQLPQGSNPSVEGKRELLPEVFFCSGFLSRTFWNCDWTQRDWVRVLQSRFIVVDGTSLDFFWNKYESREILWRRYGEVPDLEEVTFGGWLELFQSNEV